VPLSTNLYPRLFERGNTSIGLTGRLSPDRTVEQTQHPLQAVLVGLQEQFPDHMKLNPEAPPRLRPVLGKLSFGNDEWEFKFTVMFGAVAVLVFLIACANVAGLLVARGVGRRREIAIRIAVGATRLRLVRQLLLEAALLALTGTALGIGIAFLASSVLQKYPLQGSYLKFEFTPDWRFACVAAALGVTAALASGILPALASSRMNLAEAVRVTQTLTLRLRLRSLLVVSQIAVSVIMLFGAFVFIRNLMHVLRFDPGFDAAHTLQFDLTTTDPKIYPKELRERVYRELAAQPGVEGVSWAWYVPFNFSYGEFQLRRAADMTPFKVTAQGIGPGYLHAMSIRLITGRELDWNDVRMAGKTGIRPALINQAFANRYFPDRNPVGERLIVGVGPNGAEQIEVVGVSANTSFVASLAEEPAPLLQPLSDLRQSFIVRVAGSPAGAAPELARVIERSVPGAGVGYFNGRERLDWGIRATRLVTVLLGVLAALGLILALICWCGIAIYNVARRTPEIGIRMALGATAGNVLRLMLGENLALVVVGAVLGVAGSLTLTRVLQGCLAAGVSPLDPLNFAAMLSTLILAAGVAVYFPARRATRVDPLVVLRHE
jgi:predicted permease